MFEEMINWLTRNLGIDFSDLDLSEAFESLDPRGKAGGVSSSPAEAAPEVTAESRVLGDAILQRNAELERIRAGGIVKSADTDALEKSLVETGRANASLNAKGKLGGKRSETADALAEASSRKVLDGMESATRLAQMVENERRSGKAAPLSHAVSGHGKGSDQVSRLVNGRRNDQLGSEARDFEEAKALKVEMAESLERRTRVLAQKEAQLSDQLLRLEAGKPATVPGPAWDEEQLRYRQEHEQLVKAQAELSAEKSNWHKTEKKLDARIEEARLALEAALSAPASSVVLPTPEGIEGTIPSQTTVGEDPSNISGAFSTNQGMLHAVNEGFAQANMLSSRADELEKSGETSSSERIDGERFVTNVSGRGDEELGYNLEVTGSTGQRAPKKNAEVGLAHDEMAERAKQIEKTGDLQNARVVLDPAYVDGKRVGWNMQTAYANSDAPTAPINNPQELAGSLLEAERVRSANEQKLNGLLSQQKSKTSALAKAQNALANAENDIAYYAQESGKIAADPEGRDMGALKQAQGIAKGKINQLSKKVPRLPDEELQLTQLQQSVIDIGQWINKCNFDIQKTHLEDRLEDLRNKVTAAELALQQAVEASQTQKRTLERAQLAEDALKPVAVEPVAEVEQADEDEDSEDGPTGTAGYNPATGCWDGPRPSKPAGSLKGTDIDGRSLTAHHINPWNQIRDALNSALQGNATKLQYFLDFAEVRVEPWFWTELAKAPAARSYKFSEAINRMGTDICWSPKNIFMGPLGETRGDDPGEELDTAFTKGGLPTLQSAGGVLTAQTGGIGATPSEFNDQNKSRIEAKYLKKLPKKKQELKNLSPEQLDAMHQEMLDAEVWEYVRDDYPNVVAAARKKAQVEAEYKRLESQYMLAAGVSDPEEIPSEKAGELYEAIASYEAALPLEELTAADFTVEENTALEERMNGLGAGYDTAKAFFLTQKSVTSDAELNDEQRLEMNLFLADYKSSKQKLAETVMSRAKQAEGADTARENAPHAYDPEEWETNASGKRVRKQLVKAPPELRSVMENVESLLNRKVTSDQPTLRPSKSKKGDPAPTEPELTRRDYERVIVELEAIKITWERELAAYIQKPAAEGEIPNSEILKRFPPAAETSSQIDDRINHLREQQALNPNP